MEKVSDLKVGQKIKKIRELRNFTQEYMADKLAISQTSYGNLEREETEITLKRLLQVAQILEIKISDLLGFDENKMLVGNMTNNSPTQAGVIYNHESFERERKLYEERISDLQKTVDNLQKTVEKLLEK
jgi:transcriptional regulator with XRE-family HTH domain